MRGAVVTTQNTRRAERADVVVAPVLVRLVQADPAHAALILDRAHRQLGHQCHEAAPRAGAREAGLGSGPGDSHLAARSL
ncbi:MAG: hypothetical protein ACRDJ9_11305 [Dehalococcoidia bacterium]